MLETMRVLLVNTGILPVPPRKGGAIELHTYNLSNQLASLGCEVHYATGVTENAKFHPNVVLHRIRSPHFSFQASFWERVIAYAIGGFLAFKTATKALSNYNFDVIHGHGCISSRLLLITNRSLGIPFVFTVHNPTPYTLIYGSHLKQKVRELAFNVFDRSIYRKSRRIITVSRELLIELVTRWKVPKEKVFFIPNGVDTEVFTPRTLSSYDIYEKHDLPEHFALFVGRLVEQKGVEYLIKAVKGTSVHAVIVGDGPLKSSLKALTHRLNLHRQIHFMGAVPFEELRSLYAHASLFVLPSIAEGLPLAVLEAMASGLPIVATKVSGVTEAVVNGLNGFIVNVGDVNGLRDHILTLMNDLTLCKRMGDKSREIAEKLFDWKIVARKVLEVYRSALNDIH